MEKQDTFRAVVLIPAYKPDERLVQLTRELKEEKLDVLLVDDGGQQAFAHIFDECRALGAEVAVHAVNQGKGRALKTGLNAALNLWPDLSGVVTADADGQHTLRDILRIIDEELPSCESIAAMMRDLGMPTQPEDINVTWQDTEKAFIGSRDIRDKYLSSSMLWDMGLLYTTKLQRG